ncbi:plasminogen-like [Ptychodera flava]|uniref:plasminogen-like n=1 Tax=Ptychodera flava TaxID=63121 RepID=UPI003969E9CA
MRELERRVESLPNDTTISDALAPFEDDVEELELRLIRQQASLEERDAALIECQEDLTEVNRRAANQEQQIIDCQSQLDNERQQSTSLARQVNVKSAIIDNLNSGLRSQRQQIASQRSELTTKNALIAMKNGQITSLQGQVEDLERRSECYINSDASDYRGRVSRTTSGKTCQKWSSQYPHSHGNTRGRIPNAGLGDHNHCRNPDGEPEAWCYTTNHYTRWEYCNVGQRLQSCGRECFVNTDGSDYRGSVSRTRSGKTCQRWSSQSPHKHSRTPGNYPNRGLGYHNQCRNPDGQPKPWCYTTDANTRWEHCNVGVAGQYCG